MKRFYMSLVFVAISLMGIFSVALQVKADLIPYRNKWPVDTPSYKIPVVVQSADTATPTPTGSPTPTVTSTPLIGVNINSIPTPDLTKVAGAALQVTGNNVAIALATFVAGNMDPELDNITTAGNASTVLLNTINGKITRMDSGSTTIVGPVPAHGVTDVAVENQVTGLNSKAATIDTGHVAITSMPSVSGSVSMLNGSAAVSVFDNAVSTLLASANTMSASVTTLLNNINNKSATINTGAVAGSVTVLPGASAITVVPGSATTLASSSVTALNGSTPLSITGGGAITCAINNSVTLAQGIQQQMQGARAILNYFSASVSTTTPVTFVAAASSTYNDLYPWMIQNQSATACTMTLKTAATTAYGPFVVPANTTTQMPSICEVTANQPWSLTLTNAVTQIYITGQRWANTQ